MKKERYLMWLFFLVLGAVTMKAQQYQLKGVVHDEVGEAVIGATVIVEGTTNGTSTDVDGQFTLNVKNGDNLIVSYVGYITQTIKINGQKEITVNLKPDDQLLDEVVVVGYGAVQRKNFTGSVSTVKVSDSPLSIMPTSNAMDALRGTVTGITVGQQTGAGQSPSMLVRGQKSVNGGSSPLLVVDGVIFQGALRDIDPSVIESMSVLKDATSLAAYGSQAANGVIMITTKKGTEGKPLVSLSTSWAWSEAAAKPDLLSPADYIRKNNILSGLDENATRHGCRNLSMKIIRRGRLLTGLTIPLAPVLCRTTRSQSAARQARSIISYLDPTLIRRG